MALIKCSECGTEVSSEADKCPKCAFPINKTAKKTQQKKLANGCAIGCLTVFIIFAILFLVVVLSSKKSPPPNSGKASLSSNKSITESMSEKPALELKKGWEFVNGKYGNTLISGIVKNNSQKNYSYVQISFGIYDKSGAKIGTAMANINNLRSGGTWKFEASILQNLDNIDTAKLEELTGF
ncbi:MAG: FxLYD domain-containing protein [Endomicrobiales bacterium]|nr:FxLYD domain-containing protein [Endomicrobiales bacterium]